MSDATPEEKPKKGRRGNTETPSTKGRNFTKLKLPGGLTVVEEAYARARAVGMTQVDAMTLVSGGKTKAVGSGSHYEKKPHVKQRIAEIQKEITERACEKAAVDREWVLKRLMKVADRCMQEEPVLDRAGEKTGEYKFDSAGANRALELIGKEMGMFVERKQIQMNPLESLSDAELVRMAADLARQTGVAEVIDVESRLVTDQTGNGETLQESVEDA